MGAGIFSQDVTVFRLDETDYTVPSPTPGEKTVVVRQTSVADIHGSSEGYFEYDSGTVVLPTFYENTPRGSELQAILTSHGYDTRFEKL